MQNHHGFLETSGISLSTAGQGPSLLLNGMLFSQAGIAKIGGIQETIFTAAMEQTMYCQHAAYEGRLYEGLDILDLLNSDGFFVSRVNHRLLSARPPLVNKFSVGDGSDDSSLTPFLQFGMIGDSSKGMGKRKQFLLKW